MKPARRQALLDAAVKEFSENPYELASTNRILEAADFSKGSFYYYFDDKADLAALLLRDELERTLAALRTTHLPETRESFWSEVLRVQQLLLEAMEANPHGSQLTIRLAAAVLKDKQLEANITPMLIEARKLSNELWARGQALGAVRTDVSVPELIALTEGAKRAAWQVRFPSDRVPAREELISFGHHVIDLYKRLTQPERVP